MNKPMVNKKGGIDKSIRKNSVYLHVVNCRFMYLKLCDESVNVELFMNYSAPSNLGEVV